LLSFCYAASFEEDEEDGSLHQESVANGDDEVVQSLNSTALPDTGKVHICSPDSKTAHDIWQEYAHGLNGQEPLREKERRGSKWRQDPMDPMTGIRGHKMRHFWCRRRPIYLFIEMRIAMGDSEAVAVETCQEIMKKYLTRNDVLNWNVLSPLLRGVICQEKTAVTTCQEIFNKYLNKNGRPISDIVGEQVQMPNSTALSDVWNAHVRGPDGRTVRELWHEYQYGLNGQDSLREKEERGSKWRQDPIDPKTGKRGSTLQHFWSTRRPVYLFIEMRIAIGDSEAVAVETCQVIVDNYLTKNGYPNWNILSPLLRGVICQEKTAVATCQDIFNKYLNKNGRPIKAVHPSLSRTKVTVPQRSLP
jgi:hypothetical protein